VRVVHVPGLGLDGRSSEALRAALPPDVPSSVVLLPSLGLPRIPGARQLTVPGLAAQLLDQLPAEPVVLLAHSQSCQVAVAAAVAHPEAVAGLVLVGPTLDPRARPLRVLVLRWLRTARHEPPWQVPVLVRQYARTGLRTMAQGLRAGLDDRIEQRLPDYPGPVVVVRGEHDRICPHDWASELVARSRDGELVELVGAGHMPVQTQPDRLAGIVAALARRG
jgi:pimeloyl-ACP methyl ester carboxylesterase